MYAYILFGILACAKNINTIPLNGASIPDTMLGVWKPSSTPQAILGPLAPVYLSSFTMGKDPMGSHVSNKGDIWMSLLQGQLFRISGNNMQYCFSENEFGVPLKTSEQAPFFINTTSSTEVVFCWRGDEKSGTPGRGMATHKKDCIGCDCAQIRLTLTDPSKLEFLFMMSPPLVHAHVYLNRTAAAPDMSYYTKILANASCSFNNHTGPLTPAASPVSTSGSNPIVDTASLPPAPRLAGCGRALRNQMASQNAPLFDAPAVCKYPGANAMYIDIDIS